MKLSVIIVNYNVCHFLEQALTSVFKAGRELPVEVFVVDNNSADGSVEMVKAKFPQVKLIVNQENTGFSKANNQAIRQASGEYVLLLNPDTVVEEDTFKKCCEFMDNHPEAGGLGVRMLDGKGNFLPESKRGLPSPWIAFYKVFGLSALFPRSKKFGRYHLGFLDADKTHEVEVLSGAFMLLRKTALEKTGLLDEDYFMYGEDIDLSYRLLKTGFKNYYFPHTRIIHYKGESTKKTSINYVFVFYKAMLIFADKHFSGSYAGLFSFFIYLAIYLRAGLSLLNRIIQKASLPLADAALIYSGMYFLKIYWEENHKYVKDPYPEIYVTLVIPVYIICWLLSVYFSGGYDKPYKPRRIIQGVVFGTIFISAVSNFLDSFRFSKALIMLGGVWAIIAVIAIRLVLHFTKYRNFNLGEARKKRVAVVGNRSESLRVLNLLKETNYNLQLLGYISRDNSNDENYLGSDSRLNELIRIYDLDEIIFCSKDIPAHKIIEWMSRISNRMVEYKIVPDESNYVIGSNSKDHKGDFYTVNIEMNLLRKKTLRSKRALDIALSLIFLLLCPLLMWFTRNPFRFPGNIFKVLSGEYSWVGLSSQEQGNISFVKKGVITPVCNINPPELDSQTISRLNMLYARDYNVYTDLNLIVRSFRNLGM